MASFEKGSSSSPMVSFEYGTSGDGFAQLVVRDSSEEGSSNGSGSSCDLANHQMALVPFKEGTSSIENDKGFCRAMEVAKEVFTCLVESGCDIRSTVQCIYRLDKRFEKSIEFKHFTHSFHVDAAAKDIISSSIRNNPGKYLEAVDDLMQIMEESPELHIIDRVDELLKIAMYRLTEEIHCILTTSKLMTVDVDQLYIAVQKRIYRFPSSDDEEEMSEEDSSSSNSGVNNSSDHDHGSEHKDVIDVNVVSVLKEIVERMIRAGFEQQCVQAYAIGRKVALDEYMVRLGVDKLNDKKLEKIEWGTLDEMMKKWSIAIQVTAAVILVVELRLCGEIFEASIRAKEVSFIETVKGFVEELLDFGAEVAASKSSSEKLFRFLDMHDAMSLFQLEMEGLVLDEFIHDRVEEVLDKLGNAARKCFEEFENAVRRENSNKLMPGGETHPFTKYVMNYMKLATDDSYSSAMNFMFEKDNIDTANTDAISTMAVDSTYGDDGVQEEIQQMIEEDMSTLARRLLAVFSSLESNLRERSRLYQDPNLQSIFLMNNFMYMLQKVNNCEIIRRFGGQWISKFLGQIKDFAAAYCMAACSKPLSCLKYIPNPSKEVVKEMFKNFNARVEQMYRTQTGLKVQDPQLRGELRVVLSQGLIPAYSAFVEKYDYVLEKKRDRRKYMKYAPVDLENCLLQEGLFEGKPLELDMKKK